MRYELADYEWAGIRTVWSLPSAFEIRAERPDHQQRQRIHIVTGSALVC